MSDLSRTSQTQRNSSNSANSPPVIESAQKHYHYSHLRFLGLVGAFVGLTYVCVKSEEALIQRFVPEFQPGFQAGFLLCVGTSLLMRKPFLKIGAKAANLSYKGSDPGSYFRRHADWLLTPQQGFGDNREAEITLCMSRYPWHFVRTKFSN